MKKPVKIVTEAYDYLQVVDYIQKKYKIPPRDIDNFWNWILDHCGIHNGCYFYLPDIEEDTPDKMVKIHNLICKEFFLEYIDQLWVSW